MTIDLMDHTLDWALGGLVVAGLLVYLTYALIRPERF
jgi:K+-transporting ATPase KdpF subunit